MTTYQYAAPAPAKTGGTDVAAWALVALVVALICAGAGWAIARNDVMGMDDLSRATDLAARDGLARGESAGYGEGARLGRREASMRAKAQIGSERRSAAREGYESGYQEGRAKAGDPDAFLGMGGLAGGAYPAAGYEDVLASGLFGGDEPGFSTSAYDSLGYGAGGSSPYLGGSTAATSLGDDFGY
jgi:hypothetical protein